MTAFEHVMTLSSFIFALAIGTILLSVATLVHRREQVKLALAPMLWMGVVFVIQINGWLVMYTFHDVTRWSYVSIATLVIVPVLLFMQAALVVPDQSGSLDLAEHHRRNFRYYAGLEICAAALALASIGSGLLFDLRDGKAPDFLFVAMPLRMMTAIAAVIWTRRWVQIAAPALLLMIGLVGFFNSSLPLVRGG
jgi:hypothetical protein